MKRFAPVLLKGIGIVLFGIILSQIDTQAALQNASNASTPLLVLGFCLFPVIYFLKSLRWHVISLGAGAKTTFKHSTSIYMSGLFLGIITPGKVGEAMKVPALIARGLAMKDAIAITILDRIFDVLVLGLIAIWAVSILVSKEVALAALLIVLAACGIAWLLKTPLQKLQSLLLPKLHSAHWVVSLALTLINWIIFFLQYWILARAFGIAIPIPTFTAIITIAGIISILPIAPAGLGTRDAALLFFFGMQGIAAETTVAYSFTIFVLTLLASTIGAYFWLRYPLRSPHAEA